MEQPEAKAPKHKRIGTRDDVYNGLCEHTKGGLTKEDLVLNSKGKVVSKKMSELAKTNKRLTKANVSDLVEKFENINKEEPLEPLKLEPVIEKIEKVKPASKNDIVKSIKESGVELPAGSSRWTKAQYAEFAQSNGVECM